MFWMRLNKSVISILNKFDILVIFVIRILIREAKMIRSGSTSQVLRLGTTCNCLKGVVVLNQILHELAALPEILSSFKMIKSPYIISRVLNYLAYL